MEPRQFGRLEEVPVRFQLPEKRLFQGKLVVFVFHLDEVKPAAIAVERFDGGDEPAPVSHGCDGADSWIGRR